MIFTGIRSQQNVLTNEEIQAALDGVGATGNAKVERGGLYTQREENADWRYQGAVGDGTFLFRDWLGALAFEGRDR